MQAHATRISPDEGTTRRTAVGTVIGIGAALVATSIVFVVGNLGAPIRVMTGWNPDGADLTFAEVAITAASAVAAGGLLLWWMARRRPRAFAAWQGIAVAVAVVSAVPLLRLDIDAGSKLSLVSMHLLTGACAIGGQRFARISTGAVTQRRP